MLQSKASCMPAHALRPGAGWHLVDCCAAPGNKTTHAAALLAASTAAAAGAASAGTGSSRPSSKKKRSRQELNAEPLQEGLAAASCSEIKVFAFDKDPKRLKRLAANVEKAGAAGIVSAQRADFLGIDPCEPQFAKVSDFHGLGFGSAPAGGVYEQHGWSRSSLFDVGALLHAQHSAHKGSACAECLRRQLILLTAGPACHVYFFVVLRCMLGLVVTAVHLYCYLHHFLPWPLFR
jgi:hypothetical protein